MTDSEALLLTTKFTQLRTASQYQAALKLWRERGPEAMARANAQSDEHAAIRLLIGTWERIAIFSKSFSDRQRRRFYTCHPVALVWSYLGPAIVIIRANGSVGPKFAAELEALAKEYEKWTRTREGQEYRSPAGQAICALFM